MCEKYYAKFMHQISIWIESIQCTASNTFIGAQNRTAQSSINTNRFGWPPFIPHNTSNQPQIRQKISFAFNSWIKFMQFCFITSNELDPKLFRHFPSDIRLKTVYTLLKNMFFRSPMAEALWKLWWRGLYFIPPATINHQSKAYLIPIRVFSI